MAKIIFTAITLFAFLFTAQAQQNAMNNADGKILYKAKIFTADKNNLYAEAVSIAGDKIVAVGSYNDVKKTVSANALQVNMNGAF